MVAQTGPEIGAVPAITITVAGGDDMAGRFKKFEWVAFINNGYAVRASIQDPEWNVLRTLVTEDYLDKARSEPTEIKFKIFWTDEIKTEEREAILIHSHADGIQRGGDVDFIGIDPPSFFLNTGNAAGSVFEGNAKEAIEKVVKLYAPKITLEIDDTLDNKKNKWYMMRQDPKTFILSILEWSSSITKKKTNWIVTSKDKELHIKEQASLKSEDLGAFAVNIFHPSPNDVWNFSFDGDNFITSFQTKMLTQGISATTGKYLDKTSDQQDEKAVFVKDENTQNKKNVKINKDRGFKKPSDALNADDGPSFSGATSIMSIPEFSAGDMGIKYEDYIDGRARGNFLDILSMVMNMRVRVWGDARFDDPTKLGVSTITLMWNDADGKPYFLSGKWLVYGFHHVVTTSSWYTDLYIYRLDRDADAKKVGNNG